MDFSTALPGLLPPEPSPAPLPRPAAGLPPARYFEHGATPLLLGQNAPNPHAGETYVPFTLLHPADVRLEIFDLLGRKMAAVMRRGLGSGEHRIQLNLRGLCLPAGDYPYHLQAISALGTHSLNRLMTLTVVEGA